MKNQYPLNLLGLQERLAIPNTKNIKREIANLVCTNNPRTHVQRSMKEVLLSSRRSCSVVSQF